MQASCDRPLNMSGERSVPGSGLDASLSALDSIIETCRSDRSVIGVFPAMYRAVTASIQHGLQTGFFEDSEMLEVLAVTFADRYLVAYEQMRNGRRPTESWAVAFEAATDRRRRTVAQHLLAGMNAHISLDLGIVTAAVPSRDLTVLHRDYLKVNDILFSRLDNLQSRMGMVSPRMAITDRLGGRFDEYLMRTAIHEARDRAWELSLELRTRPDDYDKLVEKRDEETAELSRHILGRHALVRFAGRLLAHGEPGDIRTVIDAFAHAGVPVSGRNPGRSEEER